MQITLKKKQVLFILFGLIFISYSIYRRKKLSLYAKQFLGLKEISGNIGFEDPEFQSKMEKVGWSKGDAWCVYFVKVIWVNEFKGISDLLQKLITGNSQDTWNNFLDDKSGLFKLTETPKINDIVIWRRIGKDGKFLYRGHAGIVTKVRGNKFWTIEGNTTSGKDSDSRGSITSEGYIIAEKEHDLREFYNNKPNSLKLKGFIRYKYANI